jgi:hypothetical protein
MRRILLVLGLLVAVVTVTAAATETGTETPTGSIDVDKEVDGEPDCPDEGPCFVVDIDCADQVTRRQIYDGSGHLIEGPSTFHRIPADTVCLVNETVTGGAVVTYDPVNADTVGVVVTPEDPDSNVDQRVHVMVTNTFCKRDCVPPPTTTVPTTTSTTTTSSTTSTTTTVPPPPPSTTVPPPPTTDPTTTTDPCEPPGYDDCGTTTTTDPTTTTTEPPLSSIVTVPPTTPRPPRIRVRTTRPRKDASCPAPAATTSGRGQPPGSSSPPSALRWSWSPVSG